MGMRQRVIAVWVGVCLSTGLAMAQPTDPKPKDPKDMAAAVVAYKKAELALSKGEYAIAAREFGVAYALTQDPVLFFKIAQANDWAGDCDAALAYYGRYLNEGNPSEEYKKITTDAIAVCEKKLGISAAPKPDNGVMGPGPGPDDGGGDQGGGTTTDGSPDIVVPPLVEEPKPMVERRSKWKRTAAWVAVGATAVFATTGAVFGIKAQGAAGDVEDLFTDTSGHAVTWEGEVVQRYVDLDRDAYVSEQWAVGSFICAGVAAAAATTFFVLEALDSRGGGQATTAGSSTYVVPVVGDTWVGLGAGREF